MLRRKADKVRKANYKFVTNLQIFDCLCFILYSRLKAKILSLILSVLLFHNIQKNGINIMKRRVISVFDKHLVPGDTIFVTHRRGKDSVQLQETIVRIVKGVYLSSDEFISTRVEFVNAKGRRETLETRVLFPIEVGRPLEFGYRVTHVCAVSGRASYDFNETGVVEGIIVSQDAGRWLGYHLSRKIMPWMALVFELIKAQAERIPLFRKVVWRRFLKQFLRETFSHKKSRDLMRAIWQARVGCKIEELYKHPERVNSPGAYGAHDVKWLFFVRNAQHFLAGEAQKVLPITAEFVPTLACPMRCENCTYKEQRRLARQRGVSLQMSLPQMKELIRRCREFGVKAMIFTGGGEPLVNRHTLEGMRYAANLGLQVGLFTNGLLLSPEKSEFLLREVRPAFIRVSLDAITPETHRAKFGYAAGKDYFQRVCRNIIALSRMRVDLDSRTKTGIGFLVNPKNVDDLDNLPAFLLQLSIHTGAGPRSFHPNFIGLDWEEYSYSRRAIGIDYIAIRPEIIPGSGSEQHDSAFRVKAREACQRLSGLQQHPILNRPGLGLFPIPMGVIAERFDDLSAPQAKRCEAHAWRVSIWHDGGVYTCAENDGVPEFYFGNLLQEDFCQIWEGERRLSIVQGLRDGSLRSCCSPGCALTYLNRLYSSLHSLGPFDLQAIKEVRDHFKSALEGAPDRFFL